MVINASNKDKIITWFETNGLDRSTVDIRFDTHGLLAIQGPESITKLTGNFDINWDQLCRFQSQIVNIYGVDCLVMRTGYTGEDGIEISCPNEQLPHIWKQCIELGAIPCGLAARDSLRVEFGFIQ